MNVKSVIASSLHIQITAGNVTDVFRTWIIIALGLITVLASSLSNPSCYSTFTVVWSQHMLQAWYHNQYGQNLSIVLK